MASRAAHILKRVGTLLLGVFFWWQILVTAVWSATFVFGLLRWKFPDWQTGGWSLLCMPRGSCIEPGLEMALLSLATAAIGWLYVFRHKLRILWILMVLWGAVPLLMAVTGIGFAHPPADAVMEEKFFTYEAEFNHLAELWRQDSELQGIGFHSCGSANPPQWPQSYWQEKIPEDRWKEYCGLSEKLGIPGLGRSELLKLDIMAEVSAEPEVFGCLVLKGYAHATKEPTPLVESLDEVPAQAGEMVFKKVKGDWYLFYQRSMYSN